MFAIGTALVAFAFLMDEYVVEWHPTAWSWRDWLTTIPGCVGFLLCALSVLVALWRVLP